MKTDYTTEVYWETRIAPYLLTGSLMALAISLLQVAPPIGCIIIGAVSGGLVLLFRVIKWRTGREIFQLGAIAGWLIPFFIMIGLSPKFVLYFGFQYVAIFFSVYCAGLVVLKRRILGWMKS